MALATTALLMVRYCGALGLGATGGLLAAFLHLASFPVNNYGGTPMVDAWAHTFLVLGLLAALGGSLPGLFVASLLGMLAKETTAPLVPAVLVLDEPVRAKIPKLLAIVPGIVVHLVFRYVLAPGGYGAPAPVRS